MRSDFWKRRSSNLIIFATHELVCGLSAYPLSYRHVEQLIEEQGVYLDHATINRWVVKYSPALEVKFRKDNKPIGKS